MRPFRQQGLYAHKLRTQTSKLRAQTTRIMSNLKQTGPSQLTCTPVRRQGASTILFISFSIFVNSCFTRNRYLGHKDGIWEVSVSRMGLPILGTASADHTAMVWGMHSGQVM